VGRPNAVTTGGSRGVRTRVCRCRVTGCAARRVASSLFEGAKFARRAYASATRVTHAGGWCSPRSTRRSPPNCFRGERGGGYRAACAIVTMADLPAGRGRRPRAAAIPRRGDGAARPPGILTDFSMPKMDFYRTQTARPREGRCTARAVGARKSPHRNKIDIEGACGGFARLLDLPCHYRARLVRPAQGGHPRTRRTWLDLVFRG